MNKYHRQCRAALTAAFLVAVISGCGRSGQSDSAGPSLDLPREVFEQKIKAAPGPLVLANERPNIIIVSIDTLRADHLPLYGYPRKTMDDEWIKHDFTLFDHCYSHASWTAPSVASLFTGLYPTQHGSLGKDHIPLAPENTTIAEVMAKNGYITMAFSASPFIHPDFGFGQGFEIFGFDPTERAENLNRMVITNIEKRSPEGPFFLYVMYFDPHFTYNPPPSYRDAFSKDQNGNPLYDTTSVTKIDNLFELHALIPRDTFEFLKSNYDAEIKNTTDRMKELVDFLLARYPDSVIIITADHGEEFLEHGGMGHGQSLYQELIHVPLMIRMPGGKREIERVARPVRQIDIFPTALIMAGISNAGLQLEGVNISTLLKDLPEKDWPDFPVFSTSMSFLHKGESLRAFRLGRYKLILGENPPRAEIYDLETDPYEIDNLAVKDPALLKLMVEALTAAEAKMHPPVAGISQNPPPGRTRRILEALGYIGK